MTRRSYTRFEVKKEDWNKLPPECGCTLFEIPGEKLFMWVKEKHFQAGEFSSSSCYSSPLKRDMAEEIDTIGYFLVPDEHQVFWRMN